MPPEEVPEDDLRRLPEDGWGLGGPFSRCCMTLQYKREAELKHIDSSFSSS